MKTLIFTMLLLAYVAIGFSFSPVDSIKISKARAILLHVTHIPQSIKVKSVQGACGTVVKWEAPLAKGYVVSSNYNPGDFFPMGSTRVIYTFTKDGKEFLLDFYVTVSDNTAPVILAKNAVLYNTNGKCILKAEDVDDGSYDDCGIEEKWVYPNDFSTSKSGTYTSTLFVKDRAGNISQKSVLVEVKTYPKIEPLSIKDYCFLNHSVLY